MIESLPIIIFGSSGHQREIYYMIKQINLVSIDKKYEVLGFIEKDLINIGDTVCDGKKVIASDNTLDSVINKIDKIGIVISQGDANLKKKIFDKLINYKNIFYPNLIHPKTLCEMSLLHIGLGNIITAGTIIAADLMIENFNLINRCCNFGHDFKMGSFNTINPAVTISGNVTIGNNCLIGAGATILQGLTIQDGVTIGAGAVLTKDAQLGKTYIGIPAKELK